MNREEFNKIIQDRIESYPSNWRKGQKAFNAAEEILWEATNYQCNVARGVQFLDHIDCFYDDSKIEEFLDKCYERYNNWLTGVEEEQL